MARRPRVGGEARGEIDGRVAPPSPEPAPRQPAPRRRVPAAVPMLAACGAAAYAAGSLRAATPVSADTPAVVQVAELVTALLFVATGLLAATRPASRRVGHLVTAAGLALLFAGVGLRSPIPVAFTAGMLLQGLFVALLAHTALAFPTGRLASTVDRLVAAAAYVVILVQVPLMDPRGSGGPDNVLMLPLGAATLERAERANGVVTLLAIVAFLAALAGHWRRGSRPARRVLLPVAATAFVMAMAHAGSILVWLGAPLGPQVAWVVLIMVATIAVPVAYLGSRLRSRLAGSGVSRLVGELQGAAAPAGLPAARARALGDPTVEIAYWARDQGCFVDGDGRPLTLPDEGSGRAVTLLVGSGERIGALIHDPALADEPALVAGVCAAAGLALENERLHAEVKARLEDVQASRARIVEAADAARRRVERDLHDGAQQRLVSLAVALGMARSRLGDDAPAEVDGLLAGAAEEAHGALQELRELARGLHPAILVEEGLDAALDALAERAPLPVTLDVRAPEPLPPAVAAGAYFLVSEALANAAKHSRASEVVVRTRRDGGSLRIEVADDGVGGAVVGPRSGLEGLRDRVEALGGRLRLESPAGHGTTLRADIPCG